MRLVGLGVLLIVGVLCFAFGRDAGKATRPPGPIGRKCVGADPCLACKNCAGCQHCKKNGGMCGACKPTTRMS